ncbi:MAG: VanZ family protein [Methylococcaceae bacterium]|jgi:VanZ family protein
MIKKKLIFASVVTLGWLLLIYTESSQPPPKIFGEIPGLDKVAHFVAYGILGAMFFAMLAHINGFKKISSLSLAVFLVVLAGLSDEIHQAFVPERNADAWDLFADFCGGLFSILFIQCFLNKKAKEISHAQT